MITVDVLALEHHSFLDKDACKLQSCCKLKPTHTKRGQVSCVIVARYLGKQGPVGMAWGKIGHPRSHGRTFSFSRLRHSTHLVRHVI